MAQASREVAANDWDDAEVGTARKSGAAASIANWRKIAISPTIPVLVVVSEIACLQQ
jgi:hypothetical protein